MLRCSIDLHHLSRSQESVCPEVPSGNLHFAPGPRFMQYRSRESRSVKGGASRCAARIADWRFNSKPRVTATRTTLHRPVTRLESFRSAWISDRPVAPASLVSERRDRHGVASSTSLLPLGLSTSSPSNPPGSPLHRSHVYIRGVRINFLQRTLAVSLSKLRCQFLFEKTYQDVKVIVR